MPFFNLRVEREFDATNLSEPGAGAIISSGTLLGLGLDHTFFVVINQDWSGSGRQDKFRPAVGSIQDLYNGGYFTCFKMERFDRLPEPQVKV